MAHPAQQNARDHAALMLREVHLVVHHCLAASVALDAQEPRREGPHRLLHRVLGRGQRVVAVAAPMALWRWPEGRHGRICLFDLPAADPGLLLVGQTVLSNDLYCHVSVGVHVRLELVEGEVSRLSTLQLDSDRAGFLAHGFCSFVFAAITRLNSCIIAVR
jgi:hypothetical protein